MYDFFMHTTTGLSIGKDGGVEPIDGLFNDIGSSITIHSPETEGCNLIRLKIKEFSYTCYYLMD